LLISILYLSFLPIKIFKAKCLDFGQLCQRVISIITIFSIFYSCSYRVGRTQRSDPIPSIRLAIEL